jgi:cation transporter-like permease
VEHQGETGLFWTAVSSARSGEGRIRDVSIAMVNALQIIFIGFAGVAATRFYYAEEMLASLVLLAALFGCVAVVLLLLFMLGRASQALIAFAEVCGRKV